MESIFRKSFSKVRIHMTASACILSVAPYCRKWLSQILWKSLLQLRSDILLKVEKYLAKVDFQRRSSSVRWVPEMCLGMHLFIAGHTWSKIHSLVDCIKKDDSVFLWATSNCSGVVSCNEEIKRLVGDQCDWCLNMTSDLYLPRCCVYCQMDIEPTALITTDVVTASSWKKTDLSHLTFWPYQKWCHWQSIKNLW